MTVLASSCDEMLSDAASTRVSDYIALLKPRVMTLVVFTGFVGMGLAPNFSHLHPIIALTAMLCLALGAGAAGAINMWYDRDIDAVMARTQTRPIPAGRIDADEALTFALIMALFAVMTMAVAVNFLGAGLLAFSIFFYGVVYTMILKRWTSQNIVIGGAAGALPPVIGWAAANGDVGAVPLSLFLLIFFWTPPHFWALSLLARDEYARAQVPMLPNTHGLPATKRQMLIYTLILLPLSWLPVALGAVGWIYGGAALILSLIFIAAALNVMRSNHLAPARAMFGFSIVYLFVLFALMLMDKAA